MTAEREEAFSGRGSREGEIERDRVVVSPDPLLAVEDLCVKTKNQEQQTVEKRKSGSARRQ